MMEKEKALEMALSHIERQFERRHDEAGRDSARVSIDVIPTGCFALDHALGIVDTAWPRRGDIRAGVLGQDDAGAARDRRGAEEGRHRGLY